MPQFFYKEWQIMLCLHVVLVTLYGGFTVSIEQDNPELVTLNTIVHVVIPIQNICCKDAAIKEGLILATVVGTPCGCAQSQSCAWRPLDHVKWTCVCLYICIYSVHTCCILFKSSGKRKSFFALTGSWYLCNNGWIVLGILEDMWESLINQSVFPVLYRSLRRNQRHGLI